MCTTPVTGGMGMHLLQKMGWRPGEGLGKERNGSLQPLLLEVKLDKKGLVGQDEQPQGGRRQKQRNNMMHHQMANSNAQHQQGPAGLQQQQHAPIAGIASAQPSGGGGGGAVAAAASDHKHPVSLLGELAAKRRWTLPAYTAVDEFGQPHQKQFLFMVNVNGMNYTPAQMSNTKKEAKAVAARYALQQMGVL